MHFKTSTPAWSIWLTHWTCTIHMDLKLTSWIFTITNMICTYLSMQYMREIGWCFLYGSIHAHARNRLMIRNLSLEDSLQMWHAWTLRSEWSHRSHIQMDCCHIHVDAIHTILLLIEQDLIRNLGIIVLGSTTMMSSLMLVENMFFNGTTWFWLVYLKVTEH